SGYDGVGIPDCIKQAEAVVQKMVLETMPLRAPTADKLKNPPGAKLCEKTASKSKPRQTMFRLEKPFPIEGARVRVARASRLFMRILRLARPEWKLLSLGLVFLVIASGATLAFPQSIRMLVDGALTSGTRVAVDRAALLILVVGLVAGAASA